MHFRLASTKPTRVHDANMEAAVGALVVILGLIAAAERAVGISKHASPNLNPHQLRYHLSLRGNLAFTPANLFPRTAARSFKLYRRQWFRSGVEQGPRNAPREKK